MTSIPITDEETAAALAAVRCYLEAETVSQAELAVPPASAWRNAALLATQHIAPARLPRPTWRNIERLRRASNKG